MTEDFTRLLQGVACMHIDEFGFGALPDNLADPNSNHAKDRKGTGEEVGHY